MINIFLYSDSDIIISGIRNLLSENYDFKIKFDSSNFFEFLNEIKNNNSDFVILSTNIEKYRTIEYIEQIKHGNNNIKILFISNSSEPFYAEDILRAGAHGYISIYSKANLIISAINEILNENIFIDENSKKIVLKRLAGKSIFGENDFNNNLSSREKSIFMLLGQGKKLNQIAKKLGLSRKTVEYYCKNIKEKLCLETNDILTSYAIYWQQRYIKNQITK